MYVVCGIVRAGRGHARQFVQGKPCREGARLLQTFWVPTCRVGEMLGNSNAGNPCMIHAPHVRWVHLGLGPTKQPSVRILVVNANISVVNCCTSPDPTHLCSFSFCFWRPRLGSQLRVEGSVPGLVCTTTRALPAAATFERVSAAREKQAY